MKIVGTKAELYEFMTNCTKVRNPLVHAEYCEGCPFYMKWCYGQGDIWELFEKISDDDQTISDDNK